MALMDMGFAVICPLARRRRPQIQFLYIGLHLCSTLLSDPTSRWVSLRFANPSPPSGWVEDLHLQAHEHARHTKKGPELLLRPFVFRRSLFLLEIDDGEYGGRKNGKTVRGGRTVRHEHKRCAVGDHHDGATTRAAYTV